MAPPAHACAVCAAEASATTSLVRVYVEGRTLHLCRNHAATVVAARPETFEELRALFVGVTVRTGSGVERRSPIPRRWGEDRRAFPPRPEGRRVANGRRSTDPHD
ncbi:hypothetical protein [Polyangium jinanense]|uniref:Uncharacterized protein n=1 Tax=Polyangium jinanense TaxID=2829994 RepID=A0A9X3X153_9BACT|nr:hypothetical protein [Polyangium jinanense]MDC3953339.1 hypothetical protein [Polyangium jinanense]MDC3979541.1 hypothetical protein [Polyangium jinanense]